MLVDHLIVWYISSQYLHASTIREAIVQDLTLVTEFSNHARVALALSSGLVTLLGLRPSFITLTLLTTLTRHQTPVVRGTGRAVTIYDIGQAGTGSTKGLTDVTC